MSECSQELLWHLPCDVAEYLCSSVCQDLSCRNSCSGVELITGWVFWGELTTVHPPPPPPPLLYYRLQGSLQMTECFCPALWNPCHIPFRRTAQQQRSLHIVEQIGKRHRQNFGGKRPQFVPSGSCCRLSKRIIFLFQVPWPCLFVYGCAGEIHATISLFWKGKRYNLFPHTAPVAMVWPLLFLERF